jgi:PPOX class probable F420-dependent enzyme
MDATDMKRRLADEVVGILATVGPDGRPHVVPVCFAVDEATLYFAVDAKPKRTTNLQRLRNIAANPAVAVLIHHYEDDWSKLWWVRVDGSARIVNEKAETDRAIGLLTNRYPQYRDARRLGPVVAISIDRLSGWSGTQVD